MTAATEGDRRLAVLAFLRQREADTTPHLFGDLLTHLLGVEALARDWGGSELLALAALGHATYGTDGFAPSLLDLEHRGILADAIGPEAEAFVYLYASCDRDQFYPQLTSGDLAFGDLSFRDRFTGEEEVPRPEDVTRFVDLTLANEVELAASSPGGPAEWTWLAEFSRDVRRWASPKFYAGAIAVLEPTAEPRSGEIA